MVETISTQISASLLGWGNGQHDWTTFRSAVRVRLL